MARRHGRNGWTKGECPYSPTGWAWHVDDGRPDPTCTCEPCTPLNHLAYYTPLPSGPNNEIKLTQGMAFRGEVDSTAAALPDAMVGS